MKAMVLVPAAIAAVLALNFSTISTASSQQACQKEYIACMDTCATRSSKSIQDGCFNSCEGKNNFCAERVYGKRPFTGAPSNVAEGQGKDAMAKKQKGPAPEAAQAEAKEQVADDRAPQQEQQAPQRQAPARR